MNGRWLKGMAGRCFTNLSGLKFLLIKFYKVADQTEYWLVTLKANSLIRVEDCVVVLVGITFFVLQKDAGHMSCGKGIMVAIGSKVATM